MSPSWWAALANVDTWALIAGIGGGFASTAGLLWTIATYRSTQAPAAPADARPWSPWGAALAVAGGVVLATALGLGGNRQTVDCGVIAGDAIAGSQVNIDCD